MKHIVVAKDKETGEQRQFIFYGDWYNEPSELLVEEIFRPMTTGEKEIADLITERYVIASKANSNGNSLKKVIEAIKKFGNINI